MNTSQQLHLISFEIDAFITDRQASQRSFRTIQFYEDELTIFRAFLETQHITAMEQLTQHVIRLFLIDLGERRNKGGVHAAYRSIKAFMRWFGTETDDDNYRSMIAKVTPPSPSKEPIPGIPIEHVRTMVTTCNPKTILGQRDRSILITLLDTGVRRSELVNLNMADVNLKTGEVQVINGKGDKDRVVFLGGRGRRELIRYLRFRGELQPHIPLYTCPEGDTRLTVHGLRDVVCRHAQTNGLPEPGLHDFRRTFAIESLRNGVDIITLMHLMGHTTTTVLQRYLKLIENDMRRGHEKSSPGDRL